MSFRIKCLDDDLPLGRRMCSNAPDVGKRKILKGTLVELDEEGERDDLRFYFPPSPHTESRSAASPAGWHYVPSERKGGSEIFYYETRGNNVLAQDNPDGGTSMNGFRANGGKDLKFDFPIHMTKPGTPLNPASELLKRRKSWQLGLRMLTPLAANYSLHRGFDHGALLHEQRNSRSLLSLRIRRSFRKFPRNQLWPRRTRRRRRTSERAGWERHLEREFCHST